MPANAEPLRPSIARLSAATVTAFALGLDFDLDFALRFDFATSPLLLVAVRLELPVLQISLLRVHAGQDRGADLALGADCDRRCRDDLGGAGARQHDDAVAIRQHMILGRDRYRSDLD